MVVSSEADMAQTPGALDPLVEYELSWLGNDDPAEVLAATAASSGSSSPVSTMMCFGGDRPHSRGARWSYSAISQTSS